MAQTPPQLLVSQPFLRSPAYAMNGKESPQLSPRHLPAFQACYSFASAAASQGFPGAGNPQCQEGSGPGARVVGISPTSAFCHLGHSSPSPGPHRRQSRRRNPRLLTEGPFPACYFPREGRSGEALWLCPALDQPTHTDVPPPPPAFPLPPLQTKGNGAARLQGNSWKATGVP